MGNASFVVAAQTFPTTPLFLLVRITAARIIIHVFIFLGIHFYLCVPNHVGLVSGIFASGGGCVHMQSI
jgi:hypothetical protein